MRPWQPKVCVTRVTVFPKPLFWDGHKVSMRVRVAGEYRLWSFYPAMLDLLRKTLGSCPAPRVLDIEIRIGRSRPEFVVQQVQVRGPCA
jgi:hypothetical protein